MPAVHRRVSAWTAMLRGTPGRPSGRSASRRSRPTPAGPPPWSSPSCRTGPRSSSRSSRRPPRCARRGRSPHQRVHVGTPCRRTSRGVQGCSCPRAEPLGQGGGKAGAFVRVTSQDCEFLVVGLAGLVEHDTGNRELSDVVQKSGPTQPIHVGLWDLHLLGDHVGQGAYPLRVPTGQPIVTAQ